jgi:hypothetical protein
MSEALLEQPSREARHFPYLHPLFGRGKLKLSDASLWQRSVYYWWWEYLRRNELYRQVCEKKGHVTNGNLKRLYADFGNVHNVSFYEWWSEGRRGAELFANPRHHATVEVLQAGSVVTCDERLIAISLPLTLPKRFLKKKVDAILNAQHPSKRGVQYAKQSQAKYVYWAQPNVASLRSTLAVYDAITHSKLESKKRPYWQIAVDLNLAASSHPSDKDSSSVLTAKKVVLSATVGRMYKRALKMIDNAGKGVFP